MISGDSAQNKGHLCLLAPEIFNSIVIQLLKGSSVSSLTRRRKGNELATFFKIAPFSNFNFNSQLKLKNPHQGAFRAELTSSQNWPLKNFLLIQILESHFKRFSSALNKISKSFGFKITSSFRNKTRFGSN